MCDTFVHIPAEIGRSVIFGKNSDREPGEAQQIVRYPRSIRTGSKVRTTFIEVEHPREIHEVILSKPFRMWGAEMGCNEFSVTIGNEAVFTKIPFEKKNTGLTGMDMIRLSLEISKTAQEALHHIIEYAEQYGQDACGGYTDTDFFYHNSFIIADPAQAYVLETAGRHWAYEKVSGFRAISNGLSIEENYDGISKDAIAYAHKRSWIKNGETFSFKKAYGAWLMPKLAACASRRAWSERIGKTQDIFYAENAFEILRSHNDPDFSPHKGTTGSICMHASGLLTPHQTVGSMTAELRQGKPATVWLTGTAAPCLSIYKPFYFGNDLLNEENFIRPSATFDRSYWWQWEELHRSMLCNYPDKIKVLQTERNAMERSWIKQDKAFVENGWNENKARDLSSEALKISLSLLEKWKQETSELKNIKTGFLYPLFWKQQNKKANYKSPSRGKEKE